MRSFQLYSDSPRRHRRWGAPSSIGPRRASRCFSWTARNKNFTCTLAAGLEEYADRNVQAFQLSDAEAAIIQTLIQDGSFAVSGNEFDGHDLDQRMLQTLATAAAVVPEQQRFERAVVGRLALFLLVHTHTYTQQQQDSSW